MTIKPKTGRRASLEERAIARSWVTLHRAAIENGGSIVTNPEDPYDEQTTYRVESGHLLRVLDDFANTGTFQSLTDFSRLRASGIAKNAGPKYVDKVLAVSEAMSVSERTAARLISKKRATAKP